MTVVRLRPRRRASVSRRRAAAVAVVLLLIVGLAASLATRARAAVRTTPQIVLFKSEGPPGTKVKVAGHNYMPLETIDIYEETNLTTTTQADANGGFLVEIKICTCFGPATIQVKAVGETSGLSAQAPFTVTTIWPQFHMTPDHQGWNRFENLLSTSSVSAVMELWTGPTNNFFAYSSAVVSKGKVWVGSGDRNLYVFDAAGCGGPSVCQPLWWDAADGYMDSTPAVSSKAVYVGTDTQTNAGSLLAFALTGCQTPPCSALWRSNPTLPIHASPTLSGGFVYVVSTDGILHVYTAAGCHNPVCGDVWQGVTGQIGSDSSAAVANGMLYVGAGDDVVAFDAAGCGALTCSPVWTAPTGGKVFSSPAVANGVVYVGSEDHKLYAFDAATGAQLWTGATGDVIESSPATAKGLVYVGSFDNGIYAFDASGCGGPTCNPVWKSGTGGPIFSSPAVANGVLFVVSNDGYLYAYDAAGCGQLVCHKLRRWSAPGEASPPVSDGRVFVPGQDGNLHAFGLPGLRR